MTDLGVPPRALTRPFDGLARTAATHYRLWFFAAVARLLAGVARSAGSFDQAFEAFPFLRHYAEQLADHGLAGIAIDDAPAHWCGALRNWERDVPAHLPLRAARAALELDDEALLLMMTAALPEEDARFAALFGQLNGDEGARRPTLGLLSAWWGGGPAVHGHVRRLMEAGLLAPADATQPRADWPLAVPAPLWDALRGDASPTPVPWGRYRDLAALPALRELLLDDAARPGCEFAAALLARGDAPTVVVRGPEANGRRTLMGALARAAGRGLLEIDVAHAGPALRSAGTLATLLGALPVLLLQPGPGETATLPALPGHAGPRGAVLDSHGGLAGGGSEQALQIDLALPGAAARLRHWQQALGDAAAGAPLPAIADAWRVGSGQIRRLAAGARSCAAVAGRAAITLADVRLAARQLHRGQLDTVATRVAGGGDWRQLAVPAETQADLQDLERRCRHRERLAPQLEGPGAAGVRALFKGPSGTGKSLAARLLAQALGKDVYRVDLAAVVNKYIGETEKNLERAFSFAESLDVVLLLDEGDSLLARRTDVGSANDRYANLETNYLLQRIESFGGIVVVTTNASDRIDPAFTRRLDVVVDFPLPQPEQRLAIWALQLPDGHAAADRLLRDVAQRCALSGGQIRNAALHARSLALDRDAPLGDDDIRAAVRREYRKAGGLCPLREAG
jgi:hypothetical protein